MKRKKKFNKAFTLIEILLALTIIGIVIIFTVGISHSIRNMNKVNETKKRMELIATKAKTFYRTHRNLPISATTPPNSVPVESDNLNMEQKYRLDAWGQYFEYHWASNPISFNIDCTDGPGIPGSFCAAQFGANVMTVINGCNVNGRNLAGVIISRGPNQTIETVNTGIGAAVVFTTSSDDIIIPIDVTQEAYEIAIADLIFLNNKVKAFDAIYAGIDNNGNGGVDEDGYIETNDCPPNNGTNDPNCGMATLDAIKNNTINYNGCSINGLRWGDVTTGWNGPLLFETNQDCARVFIHCFYSLSDLAIVDPWLNGYIWGCGDCNDNSPMNDIDANNPRYHKFFSAGPDEMLGTNDDIIP